MSQESIYKNIVSRMSSLILSGIWYSDAYELVYKSLDDVGREYWGLNINNEQLEYDIDNHITSTGKRVPLPKYQPIF